MKSRDGWTDHGDLQVEMPNLRAKDKFLNQWAATSITASLIVYLLKECIGNIVVKGLTDEKITQEACVELAALGNMLLTGVDESVGVQTVPEVHFLARVAELLRDWSQQVVDDLLANFEGKVEEV